MLAYLLLGLGIIARVAVHVPNFSPVIAIALFGGAYLDRKYAIILPVALMLATDMILGFHPTMPFTWGCMALIAVMGLWVRERKGLLTVIGGGFLGAVIFYIVTNFGVWLTSGMYAKSWAGLTECYVMAIPFFKTSLLSTLVYTAVLFGLYEGAPARWKKFSLAVAK